MTIPIDYYGLHKTPEGVYYLHQGRNAQNLIGLKAPSPFEFTGQKRVACPHLIHTGLPTPDRNQWRLFSRFLDDPLVKELLPLPKERTDLVPYLPDINNELSLLLVALSRLSGPVFPVVKAINQRTPAQLIKDMEITNVAPLILTNVRTSDQSLMYELATEARMRPRKVLFTGDPAVVIHTPMKRIETTMWDVDLAMVSGWPMESFGGLLIKRFCRGEPLDTQFEREA